MAIVVRWVGIRTAGQEANFYSKKEHENGKAHENGKVKEGQTAPQVDSKITAFSPSSQQAA
jgi:hypothetical protein